MKVLKPGNKTKVTSIEITCVNCEARLLVDISDMYFINGYQAAYICGNCNIESRFSCNNFGIDPGHLPTKQTYLRDRELSYVVKNVLKGLE